MENIFLMSRGPWDQDDLRAGMLPTVLIGTAVTVVDQSSFRPDIYYVSPTQVNVLVPASLAAGPATIRLINDGLAGPAIDIALDPVAPALFQLTGTQVVELSCWLRTWMAASSVRTLPRAAAKWWCSTPRAWVQRCLLPFPTCFRTAAAFIARMADFQVWMNGAPVPAARILYAGVSPPYAGLFQINLRIPDDAPADPEIRCGFPERMSLPGGILPLR